MFGLNLPPLDAVLFTGAGLVVPPMMTSFIMSYLPVEWKASKPAYYGVKAVSVVLPGMLIRQFVGRRAGNLFMIGGLASFAVDIVREFGLLAQPAATTMGAQPFLGYYEKAPYRRGMGKYIGPGSGRSTGLPPMIQQTPERLMPTNRY